MLEPSTSEVCSVESFRAALGTSCTSATAAGDKCNKEINYSCTTTPKTHRIGGNRVIHFVFCDYGISCHELNL